MIWTINLNLHICFDVLSRCAWYNIWWPQRYYWRTSCMIIWFRLKRRDKLHKRSSLQSSSKTSLHCQVHPIEYSWILSCLIIVWLRAPILSHSATYKWKPRIMSNQLWETRLKILLIPHTIIRIKNPCIAKWFNKYLLDILSKTNNKEQILLGKEARSESTEYCIPHLEDRIDLQNCKCKNQTKWQTMWILAQLSKWL
jgi:hypothetical protein